jgi:hypothetical protein
MDEEPEHSVVNCTGQWTVTPSRIGPMISCTKCGACCSANPQRADRALHENYVGTICSILTSQGVILMDAH